MWHSPVGPWNRERNGLAVSRAGSSGRRRAFLRQRAVADLDDEQQAVRTRRTRKMARIEAVLLVADAALSSRRLAQLATLATPAEARQLVDQLNRALEHSGSAFRVERVATGYRLLTRPEFVLWLDRLHNRQTQLKLSTPALETLSIVAYRQPITRADVEAIRGVQSTDILKHLMDRGLVRIGGEEDSLGRPYLYQTTRQFLELFGLRGLEFLPNADQLASSAVCAVDSDDDHPDEAEQPGDVSEEDFEEEDDEDDEE
ncbi:MAG: SMC-Scp complex subunit ScpB [Planctomycetaceae bacterium]